MGGGMRTMVEKRNNVEHWLLRMQGVVEKMWLQKTCPMNNEKSQSCCFIYSTTMISLMRS